MGSIIKDIHHNYYILAPLTPEANERMYQYDIYEDGNVADCFSCLVLCEREFAILEHRLFDQLNIKFDIMINAYEEEILEHKHLPQAMEVVDLILLQDDNSDFYKLGLKFRCLLNIAMQSNTDVGFYF